MTDKLSMMLVMTYKTSHPQRMRNAHEPCFTKDIAYE